jgi:hypothetical protein
MYLYTKFHLDTSNFWQIFDILLGTEGVQNRRVQLHQSYELMNFFEDLWFFMSGIGAVVDVGEKERGREQEEREGEENE